MLRRFLFLFSGVLDIVEIKETLKRLGLKISDDQVKQLLHK